MAKNAAYNWRCQGSIYYLLYSKISACPIGGVKSLGLWSIQTFLWNK